MNVGLFHNDQEKKFENCWAAWIKEKRGHQKVKAT